MRSDNDYDNTCSVTRQDNDNKFVAFGNNSCQNHNNENKLQMIRAFCNLRSGVPIQKMTRLFLSANMTMRTNG